MFSLEFILLCCVVGFALGYFGVMVRNGPLLTVILVLGFGAAIAVALQLGWIG